MTKNQHSQLLRLTADVAWLMGYMEALMNATTSETTKHVIAKETSTITLLGLLELVEATKPEAPK
jgi:hypothetical protein